MAPLSRRTLLRGAGAALALPWLEAMAAPRGAKAKPPVRLAVLYMPNGVHEGHWSPSGEGRQFTLSKTLEPLAPFQNDLLIPTNLWNQAAKAGDGHYVKTSGFLTSTTVTKTLGVDINCNGISMDQVAARSVGTQTPFASLELGVSPVTTGVDKNVGYTRVYGSHIAWAGHTNPLAREINPRAVYERLLRATRPQGESAKPDMALLDLVMDDAKQLRSNLGTADQHRIDEYLSVVRSLEQRIERSTHPAQHQWKPRVPIDPKAAPESDPKEYATHVRLMLDMIALAFETDSTRVVTFMFGNAVANTSFRFLDGVTAGHHDISHHQKDPDKLRQYQIINHWHVEQYAYLLNKLRERKEGDSNVLNNSMILLGGGFRDGDKHDPHNLPLVVAGRAGGRLASGQHLVYPVDSPLSNLYLAMLQAFGAQETRFADSTAPAAGVLA